MSDQTQNTPTPRSTNRADDVRDSMPLFRSGRGGSTPTSALQLQIRRVDVHHAILLNEAWHSRLPKADWTNVVRRSPYACYVAEHDAIAYAVAIWSAPCARLLNGRGWLELRRLAIAENAPRNTASRMLRVMRLLLGRELPQIRRLISYQDTEAHTGTIYKAAGWQPTALNKCGEWRRPNQGKRRTSVIPQSQAPKRRWEISAIGGYVCPLCGPQEKPCAEIAADYNQLLEQATSVVKRNANHLGAPGSPKSESGSSSSQPTERKEQ
jgi:hypothetical protein